MCIVGTTRVLYKIVALYLYYNRKCYLLYLVYNIGTRDGLSLFNVFPSLRRRRYKFAQTIILYVYNNILCCQSFYILFRRDEFFFF